MQEESGNVANDGYYSLQVLQGTYIKFNIQKHYQH
jgi:hypothetical protein